MRNRESRLVRLERRLGHDSRYRITGPTSLEEANEWYREQGAFFAAFDDLLDDERAEFGDTVAWYAERGFLDGPSSSRERWGDAVAAARREAESLDDGDTLITLGIGTFTRIGDELIERIGERSPLFTD